MTTPKRHHYLPRFYLEGFCRNNLLWVFDRDSKEFRQQTPGNTALRKYYYSFENDDGEKTADIESLLSLVEGHTKSIIDKVNDEKLINDTEKETLSIFIGFLYSRVPNFEEYFNDQRERIVRHLSKIIFSDQERTEKMLKQYEQETGRETNVTAKELSDFAVSDRYDIEVHRNESLKMMLSLSTKLANYFRQMDWLFLYAPMKSSFVTTDDPFTLVPPSALASKGFYGIATRGTQKFVPISQRVCLVMFDRGEAIDKREGTREEIRTINLNITSKCDRFVISRDEALVKNMVTTIGLNKT